MSMLKEIIEIKRPFNDVWEYLDIARWPKVSPIFQEVEAAESGMQVGAQYIVTAGPGEAKVKYNVEVLAYDQELGRLVYKRTGGPLPGTSEWSLTKTAAGTKVIYTNHYQHDMNSTVLSSITRAMERFLTDMRNAVEKEKD
ncbi:MAG: SRPBCC family protein [candidate division KSB1 bacterium]